MLNILCQGPACENDPYQPPPSPKTSICNDYASVVDWGGTHTPSSPFLSSISTSSTGNENAGTEVKCAPLVPWGVPYIPRGGEANQWLPSSTLKEGPFVGNLYHGRGEEQNNRNDCSVALSTGNVPGPPVFVNFAVKGGYTHISHFDEKLSRVNSNETLITEYNSIYACVRHLGQSAQNVGQHAYTIDQLVQGLQSFDDITGIVQFIIMAVKMHKHHERSKLLSIVRFTVMRAFADIWHPMSGRKFLTYAEYDDLVLDGIPPSADFDQNKRFDTTMKGMVHIKLIGNLLSSNILTGCDVATAAETLWTRSQSHGYMRALYLLIRSAGDKICRKDSRDRFMTIKFKIRTVLETSDTYSYEFKSFCHPICWLIIDYKTMQSMKTGRCIPLPAIRAC